MNDLPVDGTDPPLTEDTAPNSSPPQSQVNEPVAPTLTAASPAGAESIDHVVATSSTNDGVIAAPSTAVYTAPAVIDQVPLSSQPSPAPAKRSLWSTRLSLLLVAALVGGLAGHYASSSNNANGGVTIQSTSNTPGAGYLPGGISIPKLIDKVLPSIVSIDVKGQGFEDQGTGMIITKNGLVVTNNHVIAAAATSGTITVTRAGSTKALPATLIGTNPIDDVALVRINNASGLTPVTFGNSNALVVGDSVIAIGNALGLAAGTPTVTSGIVSALGRTVTAGAASSSETLNNMIQTDAAINPGNSGGPLLDSSGDVIGMNTAVAGTLPDGTSAQNIGFAIPDATIETLLKQLKAGESVVSHGAFIGVEITSLTAALKVEYRFTVNAGAVVLSVIAGTGAATAGVKQGDVIVGINSTSITGAQDVSSVISALRPGDVVTLHIVRGKQHIKIKVTLGAQPSS